MFSQNMRLLLYEGHQTDKLKEITKDKNIQIPIDALNHNTLEYPARQFKHSKIIRFGWFGLKNGNSVVVKNGVYSCTDAR
jgi:hypothetical protein